MKGCLDMTPKAQAIKAKIDKWAASNLKTRVHQRIQSKE